MSSHFNKSKKSQSVYVMIALCCVLDTFICVYPVLGQQERGHLWWTFRSLKICWLKEQQQSHLASHYHLVLESLRKRTQPRARWKDALLTHGMTRFSRGCRPTKATRSLLAADHCSACPTVAVQNKDVGYRRTKVPHGTRACMGQSNICLVRSKGS